MKLALSSALFMLCGQAALAQRLDCRLKRQTELSYAGSCVSGTDTVISHLQLAPPSNPAVSVWHGSGLVGGRPLPIAVDAREGGTFRGGGWLDLAEFRVNAAALEFSFALNAFTAAATTDVDILRRARDLLIDTTRWVATDDQPVWIAALVKAMPPTEDLSPFYRALTAIASDSVIAKGRELAAAPLCTSIRRSLFCALYTAALESTGEYWDDRPAMYAVRASILSAGKLQHPLQQFNSQSTTTLERVHAVLDSAIQWSSEKKRCSVQRCS